MNIRQHIEFLKLKGIKPGARPTSDEIKELEPTVYDMAIINQKAMEFYIKKNRGLRKENKRLRTITRYLIERSKRK